MVNYQNIVRGKNLLIFHLLSTQTQNLYLKKYILDVAIQRKLSTAKVSKYKSCGYSSFTHCFFSTIKSKHGRYCIKNFCKDLREHATKIISCEKLETLPLTKEEKKITCQTRTLLLRQKNNLVINMAKNIAKF